MSDIFVSYRTSDEPFAAVAIDEKLSERFGADRIFRGNRTIPPGVNFEPELWGSLGRCTVLAAVIGARWLAATPDGPPHVDSPDDFVRQELAFAMKIGVRVVPILVGDAELPAAGQLPVEIGALAGLQYLRVNPNTFDHDMRHVLDTFATILREGRPRGRAIAGRYTVIAIRAHEPVDEAAIRHVLRAAADDAGFRADDLLERVHGRATVAISNVAAPAALVSDLLPALKSRLDRPFGTDGGGPLRLRVTVDVGDVMDQGDALAGEAVDRAARLLRADAFDLVFSASPSTRLVLAVSDDFYRAVVLPAVERLDASTFRRFRLDGQASAATAWAHVPGSSAPLGLPLLRPTREERPRRPGGQRRQPGSIVNSGNVWVKGDQFTGDKINGRFDGGADEERDAR